MTTLVPLDRSAIQCALSKCALPEVRRLIAVEQDDCLEVYGRVSSYYLKSMAIETAKLAAEGRTLRVHIEVLDS